MSKKKNKSLDELLEETLVPEGEQSYEIPENWIWLKFNEVFETVSNPSGAIKLKDYNSEGNYPIVDQSALEIGGYTDSEDFLYNGSLPVIVFGDHTKNIKWIDFKFAQGADGTKLLNTKLDSLNKYYYYCLKQINLPNKGYSRHFKFLKETFIPIAPLNEQQRIVDKIEILFVKIDEAQQLIREAKETFEHRRAAILSVLFQKNVESVKNKSENEPYKLPVGWKWLKLSEVGTLKRGKSKHRPRNDAKLFGGPYPFIQTGDVARAEKYIESYSQTLSEFGLAQSALFEKGTLCITIAANIADTALLNFDSCFPDSVVGFSSNHEYISNEYIHYYISTIKQKLEHYAPATAQKNINLKVLNEVLVPIPPHEEYLRIIGAIKDLELKERSVFNLIDLEKQINQLKQSILSKAFKGELGTIDPTDEPAIELLKSILQEKL